MELFFHFESPTRPGERRDEFITVPGRKTNEAEPDILSFIRKYEFLVLVINLPDARIRFFVRELFNIANVSW